MIKKYPALVLTTCLCLCAPAAQADQGKALYKRYCTVCHQLPAPKELAQAGPGIRLDEKMDYLRLSGKQRKLLNDYIRSLK